MLAISIATPEQSRWTKLFQAIGYVLLISICFRHLRFLLKSAEDMLKHQPSLTDLQNQATVTQTEVQAIKSELAATTRKQAIDHISLAKEKDGRTNEG
jgi:hypothetical protein